MVSIGNTVFFSIKALYKRIIDIENKLGDIIPTSDINDINSEIDHIQNNLDDMIIEQTNFKKTFTSVQANVGKLATDIDTIKETQINTNNDLSSHNFYIEDIENDIVSINTKMNNFNSNISRIDLTFENINKDFKLLETFQNEQQDSFVELASNNESLTQTVNNLQNTQHTDKLELLYKIDEINDSQVKLNSNIQSLTQLVTSLQTTVNSFDARIQNAEQASEYCKERVQYCEGLCIDTNNNMILFNNATTALTNQMAIVDDTMKKNSNLASQIKQEMRDFNYTYDLLKKQLDAALVAAQRGDLIEIDVLVKVTQMQLDSLLKYYSNTIQFESFPKYNYSGLRFYGIWNTVDFTHAVLADLESISEYTRFYNCNMQKAKLMNNDYSGVGFVNCDLANTDFKGAIFHNTTFNGCNVNEADFTNADFSTCEIYDTDFTTAITIGVKFPPPYSDEDPAIISESDEDGESDDENDPPEDPVLAPIINVSRTT